VGSRDTGGFPGRMCEDEMFGGEDKSNICY